jgi:hypothetical protein
MVDCHSDTRLKEFQGDQRLYDRYIKLNDRIEYKGRSSSVFRPAVNIDDNADEDDRQSSDGRQSFESLERMKNMMRKSKMLLEAANNSTLHLVKEEDKQEAKYEDSDD